MRLAPRRALAAAALVVAFAGAWLALTLPPRARAIVPVRAAAGNAGALTPTVVRGAHHVHTTRSDGTGTIDEVAAAAARAGLQFVLVTDHGDGTRAPLPPAYRSGVLCLDGVEISTAGGHYIALDLPQTPYRLSGDPADVVEDVARFGGFGVIAHPDSPKPELAWAGWDLPFDGLEWLNLDTEWRDESRARILWGLAQHLVRPVETVASLVGDGTPALRRWDQLTRDRRVVGLAGVDAHARFGLESGFEGAGRSALRVPSYETSFRTIHVNVELARPLTRDAAADAAAVIASVRAGRVFSSIDALAPAGRVDFHASAGAETSRMGGFLAPGDRVTFNAAADAPADARLRLVCDGIMVRDGPAGRPLAHEFAGARPGACRLEVGWPDDGGFTRWIVSNPIYLRSGDAARVPAAPTVLSETDTLGDRERGAQWRVEHDPASRAAARAVGAGLGQVVSMTYALRPGPRASQYAALVTPDVESLARFTHVAFVVRGDRPGRVSVQVREPRSGADARRWQRTVYVDTVPREQTIALDDLRPVPPTGDPHPPRDALRALLFVVDTGHTPPGTAGTLWIERLRAGRP